MNLKNASCVGETETQGLKSIISISFRTPTETRVNNTVQQLCCVPIVTGSVNMRHTGTEKQWHIYTNTVSSKL